MDVTLVVDSGATVTLHTGSALSVELSAGADIDLLVTPPFGVVLTHSEGIDR